MSVFDFGRNIEKIEKEYSAMYNPNRCEFCGEKPIYCSCMDNPKMRKTIPKPPIGIIPKFIWIEQRIDELKQAIVRYLDADRLDPVEEWLTEIKELQGILKK